MSDAVQSESFGIRGSYADFLTEEVAEKIAKAFPEEWWEGKPVRLRFWMRWFFALVSKDWNRIHFRRIIRIQKRPSVVAHGLMLTILLPRLTQEWFEKLQETAGSWNIVDTSLSCKFLGFCRAHSYVRVRVRRKNIRKESAGVLVAFDFEILAPDIGDQIIQKGTRMLLIASPG